MPLIHRQPEENWDYQNLNRQNPLAPRRATQT
jgi:hypothetical protein